MYITFEQLPEAKHWKVGENYRVKLVLKQTSSSEDGAEFEIVDANSLESKDKIERAFISSDSGLYGGK